MKNTIKSNIDKNTILNINENIKIEVSNYITNNRLSIENLFINEKVIDKSFTKDFIRKLVTDEMLKYEKKYTLNLAKIYAVVPYSSYIKYFDLTLPVNKILNNALYLYLKDKFNHDISYRNIFTNNSIALKNYNYSNCPDTHININLNDMSWTCKNLNTYGIKIFAYIFFSIKNILEIKEMTENREIFDKIVELEKFLIDKKSIWYIYKDGEKEQKNICSLFNMLYRSYANTRHPYQIKYGRKTIDISILQRNV